MELRIARMAAYDGIAFAKFTSSKDLRELLATKGYKEIPTSPETIKNIVMKFAEMTRNKYKVQIQGLRDQKFNLTFDEWTNGRNRRYINLNLHG